MFIENHTYKKTAGNNMCLITLVVVTCRCTERNKWYILTHLGESGYCLQINPNYQVNWPNCCKFSGQWPRSLWNQWRWKSQFTLQPATQFTVPYYLEVSVRISTLTLLFNGNLPYFLFILHCYERIYIYIYIYIWLKIMPWWVLIDLKFRLS